MDIIRDYLSSDVYRSSVDYQLSSCFSTQILETLNKTGSLLTLFSDDIEGGEYHQELRRRYLYYLNKKVTGVSGLLMEMQSELMDGLQFLYNFDTDELSLYTANLELLKSLGAGYFKNKRGNLINWYRDSIISRNKDGSLFCYRIIVGKSTKTLYVKSGSLNEHNCKIVPFRGVDISLNAAKTVLNAGIVRLKMVNAAAKHFSNEFGKVEISVLSGQIRGFCIESSSILTMDVWNIDTIKPPRQEDVFKLNTILTKNRKVKEYKDGYTNFDAKSYLLGGLIYDQVAKIVLEQYKTIAYWKSIKEEEFSKRFSDGLSEGNDVSYGYILSCLRGFSPQRIARIASTLPVGEEFISNYLDLFSGNMEVVSSLDQDTLKEKLSSGALLMLYERVTGLVSELLVTNSRTVLKCIYGEDYFAKKESVGVRAYSAQYWLDKGEDYAKVAAYCGFREFDLRETYRNSPNFISDMKELEDTKDVDSGGARRGNILSRRVNQGEETNFYASFHPSRVVRAWWIPLRK